MFCGNSDVRYSLCVPIYKFFLATPMEEEVMGLSALSMGDLYQPIFICLSILECSWG